MALAEHDAATAAWADSEQSKMERSFSKWWIPDRGLYADSMCAGTEGDCSNAGEELQQGYWTGVSPMEQGIAPSASADRALATMEGPTFSGSCGLYVDGVGGPEGPAGQTCYLVNTGALAVAEGNYGRTAPAVADMDKIAGQLTVEMPGALPELAASAQYDPFQAFTTRANVMQAWSSYGLLWTVVHDLLGVVPDAPAGALSIVPDVPAKWPTMSVSDLAVGDSTLAVDASQTSSRWTTQVRGVSGFHLTIGTVLPASGAVRSVTLGGHPVPYKVSAIDRGKEVTTTVAHPSSTETFVVSSRA